ncbi:MAG: hypothetical protein LBO64_10060 [Desulfovibrio sp.]|nr:hypothetical protein [Desulfovibrio sp.]
MLSTTHGVDNPWLTPAPARDYNNTIMKIDGSLPGAPDELRKEAVFLYKAAFNKSIPDTLLERYLRAHADLTKQ